VTQQEKASIEDELVTLMDRYETPIFNYLVSVLRDRDLALDCAQDTCLRAYEALCRHKVITAKWLYTVACNRAVEEFRRRRHVHPDGAQIEDILIEGTRHESALEAQIVVKSLPVADREVLYLFEIAGFKTDEIGAMLGVRGSAIRQRLMRARQRFRALYDPDPGDSNRLEATLRRYEHDEPARDAG
jgi:RNA polymerase sigma-70 factor (ECF subfamily)